MSVIDVKNLTVSYNEDPAILNVSFQLDDPSITVILGPNGAGKTTLLKALIGMIKPDYGVIRVLGFDPLKDTFKLRQFIGYVPQRDKIVRNIPLKVRNVILMGLLTKRQWPRISSKSDVDKMHKILELLDLTDFANKTFGELSGGQQQKVLLARALISEPKILFLDEPFNGVDIKSQAYIIEKIKSLRYTNNITVLIVTHDINPLIDIAENLIILNKSIVAIGKPLEVLTEQTLSKAYGGGKVIIVQDRCYTITGDVHSR
ncbi:MAG: metal ABC transporter ATP-binding protein [Thermoprotei archaeon]|jgi:ABC-type Mn2+/Zn2+ transport system ATPase subunit